MVLRGERFVVLGLAHVRSPWFGDVARWATSAALPLEFVKAVSVEELRTRLHSGRALSALLVDAGLVGVDRDLIAHAHGVGCATLIVDDGRSPVDWGALGAAGTLSTGFGRAELLDALTSTATPVTRSDDVPIVDQPTAPAWRGRLVAVTGPGGTGASTLAMALAQGFGADPRLDGHVLLADLALDADLAMLHDVGDVVPGVQELVEAHRLGRPAAHDIRSLTYAIPEGPYSLLLGLRRHRDWAALRPRALEAALDGLRRTFKIVVADITGDLEGEQQCGSIDVEERNGMARNTLAIADAVVVVGDRSLRGLHRLVRLVSALVELDVDVERVIPVINRAPRSPKGRAEVTAAIAAMADRLGEIGAGLAPPVQLTERRRVEESVRDCARFPPGMVGPVCSAVTALLDRLPSRSRMEYPAPVRVRPGSLGLA